MEETGQGILLNAIPYLGQKKILRVFTREHGLISLMAQSGKLSSLTSPFCIAEWVYRKSQRDLSPLIDGTLLDPLSHVRTSYDTLMAAGSMASDLLRSQMPMKPSGKLYDLLASYFRKLTTSHPQTLAASFRLKLLLHDGLLSLRPQCAECESAASSLIQGESYCDQHGKGGVCFLAEEWQILLVLGYGRQFSMLEQIEISQSMQERTRLIFQERIL